MRDQRRRVERLEGVVRLDADCPPYVCVGSLEELEALDLDCPVKAYVGICPDVWDQEADHED